MTPLTSVCRTSPRFLRLAIAAVASLSFTLAVFAAPTTKKNFDLPSGDAATTLKLFAKQSGEQIVYPLEQVRGVKTNAVKGEAATRKALDQMLDGTILEAVQDEKTGAIAIKRTLRPVPAPGKNKAFATEDSETAARQLKPFELDPYRVTASRQNPYADGNLDIPRSINDVQPYYVFDSTTISSAGTTNLEDFLRERVTMNALAMSQLQGTGSMQINTITGGRRSQVDLRGLGVDKTVVLVNGRRTSVGNQVDVNAIPIGLVERIEVLPAASSAIYGGNAIGGVVNIILKRNYNNTRMNLRFETSESATDETRKVDLYSGFTLKDGKTQIQIQLSHQDGKPLYLRDRQDLYLERVNQIRANNPTYFNSATTAILGALPNIVATSGSTLTLDNGTVINSPITFVPAGTGPDTPLATLYAGLAANGGQISMELPETNQRVGGLKRPLTSVSGLKTVSFSAEREMTKWLRLRAEFSYQPLNYETQTANALIAFPISAASPANPFNQAVSVAIPMAVDLPVIVTSLQRSYSLGAIFKLPGGLQGTVDYYRGISSGEFDVSLIQTPASASHPIVQDINAGIFKPFVDPTMFPYSFDKYILRYRNTQDSTYNDRFNFRVNGPISLLPMGDMYLTFGGEHAIARYGESRTVFPAGGFTSEDISFARKEYQSAVFGEITVPLVPASRWKLLDALEAQVAGRLTDSKLQTGTTGLSILTFADGTEFDRSFTGNVLPNGQPYTAFENFRRTNFTMGLKYSPVRDLTIRASRSTAFLPPRTDQMNAQPDGAIPTTANVTDPHFPLEGPQTVTVVTGGNPDLRPQSSTSHQIGVVWSPSKFLRGLRLNVEYWENEQQDAISRLSAQQTVDFESTVPQNVTRGSDGRITRVDTRWTNLFNRQASGIDYSLSYQRAFGSGNDDHISLSANHSTALHNKTQYAVNRPSFDSVDFPSEGGPVRQRTNLNATWRHAKWRLTWATQRIGEHKIRGAAGGPASLQTANGGVVTPATTVNAQGGEKVSSQIYHDMTLAYATGEQDSAHEWRNRLLGNVVVTVGVRNVFDKVPPLDVSYTGNFYTSPFVGLRLRHYWIEVSKSF